MNDAGLNFGQVAAISKAMCISRAERTGRLFLFLPFPIQALAELLQKKSQLFGFGLR